MRIDCPSQHHIPALRRLWQEAFGDTDVFLDSFFRTAFSPDRCRCVLDGDSVAAVLYWFDCRVKEQKLAYIYAVVTNPAFRNRGLCRSLMADTHALLTRRGYSGTVLVPQKESLRAMYAGMGYENIGGLQELRCAAGGAGFALRAIGPAEFAALRRNLLPDLSVVQEGENLLFLSEQAQFYTGQNFLLAAYGEKETLHGIELLGDCAAAPGILKTLGYSWGQFRMPGKERPFAMFHSLTDGAEKPEYFGFAFD